MAYLVRKIARSKWPDKICPVEELPGDTIADIRTSNNELSVWLIDSTDGLDSAALALSASSKTDKIEKLQLVWIPLDEIEKKQLNVSDENEGDTIIPDLADMHRDLNNLTYGALGKIASIIQNELLEKNNYKLFSRGDVKKALVAAYKDRRIAEERCSPKLLEEIRKAVSASSN